MSMHNAYLSTKGTTRRNRFVKLCTCCFTVRIELHLNASRRTCGSTLKSGSPSLSLSLQGPPPHRLSSPFTSCAASGFLATSNFNVKEDSWVAHFCDKTAVPTLSQNWKLRHQQGFCMGSPQLVESDTWLVSQR